MNAEKEMYKHGVALEGSDSLRHTDKALHDYSHGNIYGDNWRLFHQLHNTFKKIYITCAAFFFFYEALQRMMTQFILDSGIRYYEQFDY